MKSKQGNGLWISHWKVLITIGGINHNNIGFILYKKYKTSSLKVKISGCRPEECKFNSCLVRITFRMLSQNTLMCVEGKIRML